MIWPKTTEELVAHQPLRSCPGRKAGLAAEAFEQELVSIAP
jgi:hypothetical protein